MNLVVFECGAVQHADKVCGRSAACGCMFCYPRHLYLRGLLRRAKAIFDYFAPTRQKNCNTRRLMIQTFLVFNASNVVWLWSTGIWSSVIVKCITAETWDDIHIFWLFYSEQQFFYKLKLAFYYSNPLMHDNCMLDLVWLWYHYQLNSLPC